jgi:hypothetical protein
MERLPDRWSPVLQYAPEAGMGYSGFVVEVPGYAGIPFRGF